MYVGDGSAYVPIPSLKTRPLNPNLQALQTLQGLQGLAGSGGTGVVGDEDWRRHPETWDREHRRYRPNTTRVQREYQSSFSYLFAEFDYYCVDRLDDNIKVNDFS